MTKGKETSVDCVRVYVVYKIIDPNGLAPKSLVPPYFGNHVPTDVIELDVSGGGDNRRNRRIPSCNTVLRYG